MKITEMFSGSNTFHTFKDVIYAILGLMDYLNMGTHSRDPTVG